MVTYALITFVMLIHLYFMHNKGLCFLIYRIVKVPYLMVVVR